MSEDFFLINGPLGDQGQNDSNGENNNNNNGDNNNPVGCGAIVVLIFVMFLLSKCLF